MTQPPDLEANKRIPQIVNAFQFTGINSAGQDMVMLHLGWNAPDSKEVTWLFSSVMSPLMAADLAKQLTPTQKVTH